MCGNNGVQVNKQSYFSQTFYAYPPRREREEGEGEGRVGAQEMCQLYGSLGSETESVEATCEEEEEGEGKTSKRKILWGNFKKARGRRETDTESESKWIGELAELLRPAECLECRPG